MRAYFAHARISSVNQINADTLASYLAAIEAKGRSARTINMGRESAIAFANWCVSRGRLSSHNLAVTPKRNTDRDRRRIRRALTDDEITRLRSVAKGISPEREAWYFAALLAGLRRGDLLRLSWGDVDLESGVLTIVAGKAKRADQLPLHPELADMFRAIKPASATARDVVFPDPPSNKARRRDFEAAGIPHVDEDGRIADLHALRSTRATMLARGGVQPQVARTIMRHSDYKTTLASCTHLTLRDAREALNGIPFGDTAQHAEPSADHQRKHQQLACKTVLVGSVGCGVAVRQRTPRIA